jgi:hypothetical protein
MPIETQQKKEVSKGTKYFPGNQIYSTKFPRLGKVLFSKMARKRPDKNVQYRKHIDL